MRRLNQAIFILQFFGLLAFSGLCVVFVVSVFHLYSVLYFTACTNMNGTVYPNCADVSLRIYSLTPQVIV